MCRSSFSAHRRGQQISPALGLGLQAGQLGQPSQALVVVMVFLGRQYQGSWGGARLDPVSVLDTVNKIPGLGHSGFLRSLSSPVLSGCSSMYLCTYRTLIL